MMFWFVSKKKYLSAIKENKEQKVEIKRLEKEIRDYKECKEGSEIRSWLSLKSELRQANDCIKRLQNEVEELKKKYSDELQRRFELLEIMRKSEEK
jgi:hypothetical protein